jgi:C-terminal processing protease CtpA/Prc
MLGELNDAHTHLVSPTMDQPKFASVSNLGDLAVIDQVGYSASMAGLESGMLLVEINNEPINSLIDGIDISTHSAATPWANKVRAMNYLLEVPEDENEALKVKVIDSSGNELELIIKRLSPPTDWQASQNQTQNKAVRWEFISDDIGYIRIDRLWNSNDDIVSEFDSALESLFETSGLILDLRQNGGGDSRIGDKIAGRFLNEPYMYGTDHFRNRIYSHAWKKSVNYFVNPRGKIYPGKLVVLTDYGIMSSAEWLVGALTDSDRAISIGRTTGGSTGNPIQFSIPGGMVRYSTAAFYRPDGRLVEGVGYEPDILVDYTIDDFKKGIDPDIQTAIEWLEEQ